MLGLGKPEGGGWLGAPGSWGSPSAGGVEGVEGREGSSGVPPGAPEGGEGREGRSEPPGELGEGSYCTYVRLGSAESAPGVPWGEKTALCWLPLLLISWTVSGPGGLMLLSCSMKGAELLELPGWLAAEAESGVGPALGGPSASLRLEKRPGAGLSALLVASALVLLPGLAAPAA